MTGMEVLEQQLMERYSMAQGTAHAALQGVTIKRVLEIFAQNMGLVSEAAICSLREREEAVAAEEKELQDRMRSLTERERASYDKLIKAEAFMKAAQEKEDAAQQILDNISQAETAEARDRIRLLQIFKGNVEIETPQNNSVYIAGVASILSGIPVFNDISAKKGK